MNFAPVTAQSSRTYGQVTARNRGVTTVTLGVVGNTAITNTGSSYIFAKFDLASVGSLLTLLPDQPWAECVNCVPAVSYKDGAVTRRWLLSRTKVGAVYCPLYLGEVIKLISPTIELWTLGIASTARFSGGVIQIGRLLKDSSQPVNYNVAPCLVSVTGGSLFTEYMTSCNFIPA